MSFSNLQGLRHRQGCRLATLTLLVSLLAACDGGSDSPQAGATTAQAQKREQRALAGTPSIPVTADAATKGMWGPLTDWPLISVHMVLMPDRRVLSYGSIRGVGLTAHRDVHLWDINADLRAGHQVIPNGPKTDLFCSSQLLLPPTTSDGLASVFIAGGDNWDGRGITLDPNNNTNIFNAGAGVVRGNNMNRLRWYSSSTMLVNGEVYIQGGKGGDDFPEVRGTDGSLRLLTGANTEPLASTYPRNFVMPDGRLFGFDSNGKMYFVNTQGTGSISTVGNFDRQYGSSHASAAMYQPGKILQFGGDSNGAIIIDVTSGTPVWTPTSSMRSQRRLATATLLADGTVLATGGSPVWNEAANAELAAEIWNPSTQRWTVGALAAAPRLYHSNALLLPDATVLVTGGNGANNAQIYYPPYLFTANGQVAPRPVVSNAPNALDIGKTFTVTTAGAGTPSRVVLLKTGSATHNWNMDQRFVDLAFSAQGTTLTVQAPTRPGEVTPGYYMLFVINSEGVPSEGHMMRLGVAGSIVTTGAPVLANPGNRTTTVGDAVSLTLNASDPNGDALRFSASGLPAGLTLDATTGLITGVPTTACDCSVTLVTSDGSNSTSVIFNWKINPQGGFQLTQVPAPMAVQTGSAVSFAAAALGTGIQYAWQMGDGSATTPWSSNGHISHAYTAPGTYVVTLHVRDHAGNHQSRSFLQTVYLPPTARAPASSSTLLWEQPPTGDARLWVVNPDNDSVTVFNASTRSRLAEVPVGSSPRAIARASNGMIWVSNKRSASISVIDPATRQVVRTINLQRASQPHGLVISPTSNTAFVALEASGQLLRLDTNSYATTGALGLGDNLRHLSVASDGEKVYVSRFITPPLPGEGTAVVSTPAGVGGELLQVSASSMLLTRKVILAHSDKTDEEAQGSGIPNYLGAMAISPDGSQGYVPSKQDNIKRGMLRNRQALNFQNTVRAIGSRVVLSGAAADTEDLSRRVDLDDASLATAATYDRRGNFLFVALETSREVAVVDAHGGTELMRFDTGRAPQGLQLSADGLTLYVDNFMDRTVGVYDLRTLLQGGQYSVPLVTTLSTVGSDKLTAQVLLGKQLFYDARDSRLARDRYMSCASCHNDGGQDGRTWDLTHAGEGLRNTINLRGRGGSSGSHGRLHWSGNFDEVQDFEMQIRQLAGGSGLLTDAQLNTGTRAQPLGDRKAGVSSDLDALSAYLASLNRFEPSPVRDGHGALTVDAAAGKSLFLQQCLACHGGDAFSNSSSGALANVGTVKPSSGQRLFASLTGIDSPTLRDAWATAPYLHDGSAATIADAIKSHTNLALGDSQVRQLAAYVAQIGSEEPALVAGGGSGLLGEYFNNRTHTGAPVLTRTEAVSFNWGSGSPGPAVGSDNFSVRWKGQMQVPSNGAYRFQTNSNDGVRLWINGNLVINNWTQHSAKLDTSAVINLTAGQRVNVVMEYFEGTGTALIELRWQTPGASAFTVIPAAQLSPP